jgi:hypothetical protein
MKPFRDWQREQRRFFSQRGFSLLRRGKNNFQVKGIATLYLEAIFKKILGLFRICQKLF